MSAEILHYGANERKAVLLEKLGGPTVLRRAIDTFYTKQLHDADLMVFFRGVNVEIIKWHQFNLMSIAFTAVPQTFDVGDLILTRHQRLFDEGGLCERHFDLVLGHFKDTLVEMKVDQELIEEAVGVVMPLRAIFEQGARESVQRRKVFQFEHRVVVGVLVTVAAILAVRLVRSRK